MAMKTFLKHFATPLITGFFLVSLVSGTALYFHWQQNIFKDMHETLSMVLIIPFLLHLFKNWRAFWGYFTGKPFLIAAVIAIGSALYFAAPALMGKGQGQRGGRPPQFAFAEKVMAIPLQDVVEAFDLTPDAAVEKLKAAGFSAAAKDVPLGDIAKSSGKRSDALMRALMQ
jgi:hypothetical protein